MFFARKSELEDLKAELQAEIVRLSRDVAHAVGDMDAALDLVSRDAAKRLAAQDARIAKLEGRSDG